MKKNLLSSITPDITSYEDLLEGAAVLVHCLYQISCMVAGAPAPAGWLFLSQTDYDAITGPDGTAIRAIERSVRVGQERKEKERVSGVSADVV